MRNLYSGIYLSRVKVRDGCGGDMITNADIVRVVKQKLGDRVEITDENIDMYVDEARQEILNYCHINEVPYVLKYTWANIATDYILLYSPEGIAAGENGGSDEESDVSSANITSVSVGGINVSLSTDKNNSAATDIVAANKQAAIQMSEFIRDYAKQLQVFRRLLWQ